MITLTASSIFKHYTKAAHTAVFVQKQSERVHNGISTYGHVHTKINSKYTEKK